MDLDRVVAYPFSGGVYHRCVAPTTNGDTKPLSVNVHVARAAERDGRKGKDLGARLPNNDPKGEVSQGTAADCCAATLGRGQPTPKRPGAVRVYTRGFVWARSGAGYLSERLSGDAGRRGRSLLRRCSASA